jgi:hypothetical protein
MSTLPLSSTARTLEWAAVVLFGTAEVVALTFAYTTGRHSTSPFLFFVYFLPIMTLVPWAAGWKMRKVFQTPAVSFESFDASAVSMQISGGIIAAYALFVFTLSILNLLSGN